MNTNEVIQHLKHVILDSDHIYRSPITAENYVIFSEDALKKIFENIPETCPKLLSKSEVIDIHPQTDVWLEIKTNSYTPRIYACTAIGFVKSGKYMTFFGEEHPRKLRDYNQNVYYSWRLWSGRPSKDQINSTPWNGK